MDEGLRGVLKKPVVEADVEGWKRLPVVLEGDAKL
jgi:hypothetical protein